MSNDNLKCAICGDASGFHAIKFHLRDAHPGWQGTRTPEEAEELYKRTYPGHPIYSALALRRLQEAAQGQVVANPTAQAAQAPAIQPAAADTGFLHELFGLGKAPEARSDMGNPIPVRVVTPAERAGLEHYVPEVDEDYVYDIDLLKTTLFAIESNIPIWLWGHSGVGKSSILEQIAARTGRPSVRVQHSASTERHHVIGQVLANSEGTYFEPGPLPLAMKHGMLYIADEYDTCHPTVSLIYQAVLEGKPLLIDDAPAEWRRITPHPNFRIAATANTNGSGDETGLFTGTNIMNAANVERFGIVRRVNYISEMAEIALVQKKVGLVQADAAKLVRFAADIRKAYDERTLSAPISTRTLIYAARNYKARGRWERAIEESFTNRLPTVDAQAAIEVMQRHFA